MKALEKLENVYQCQGKVLNSGRENVVENVVGTHVTNKSNFNVESLNLVHQKLKKFPEKLNKFFPNLIKIYLGNCNLQSITADDLKHFKSLRVLDVWNNQLTSLPGDLFRFTPKVERVYFAKNQISVVGEGLLDGLSLQYADFRHNRCIDLRAQTRQEVQRLKQEISEKCSQDQETFDSSLESSSEILNESLTEKLERLTTELKELKQHFKLQSETIISMAKEVIEQKENLKSQGADLAEIVSEAGKLIFQVVESFVEQGESIESLEEQLEEQDELLLKYEERLTALEERSEIKK